MSAADRRRRPTRPTPPPLLVDTRRVVLIGTVVWLAAAIALAAAWGWLSAHDHRDWLWTAVVGALLGLAGLALIGRHRGQGRA